MNGFMATAHFGEVMGCANNLVPEPNRIEDGKCFCTGPPYSERGPLLGSLAPPCTVRVFVQGLCTVARATAPLCAGFPRCGRRVCGRWVCGRGGFCFLFGSGECLRFSVSGVGAGVGPCVFGCWLALLPSLALFGGLPLDPDYAVPAAEKKELQKQFRNNIKIASLR